MYRIGIVIPVRYESTRLPGKCFLPFNNTPALKIITDRLKAIEYFSKIILAMPHTSNWPIFKCFCETNGLTFFMDENIKNDDVLTRVFHAALKYNLDYVFETTQDCPLVTSSHIERMSALVTQYSYDCVTNNGVNRVIPDGADLQVMPIYSLRKLSDIVVNPIHRSHLFWNALIRTDKFGCRNLTFDEKYHHPDWRFCLDTIEDYQLLTKIFNHFGRNDFSIEEATEYVSKNKYLLEINKKIIVKNPYEEM